MLPAAHILISIGIGFAMEVKFKNKYLTILTFGLLGLLPDLDHFLPPNGSVGMLHNIIILGEMALVLIIASSILEPHFTPRSSKYQRFFISFAVILYGHVCLDLIAGGTFATNLAGTNLLHISSMPIVDMQGVGVVFSSTDIIWVALGILVLSGNLIQKKLYALIEEYYAEDELEFGKQYPLDSVLSRSVALS